MNMSDAKRGKLFVRLCTFLTLTAGPASFTIPYAPGASGEGSKVSIREQRKAGRKRGERRRLREVQLNETAAEGTPAAPHHHAKQRARPRAAAHWRSVLEHRAAPPPNTRKVSGPQQRAVTGVASAGRSRARSNGTAAAGKTAAQTHLAIEAD